MGRIALTILISLRVQIVLQNSHGVNPETDLHEDLMQPLEISLFRLAGYQCTRYFGRTPELWMNVQEAYDLEVAARKSKRKIERDVHPREVA